MHPAAVQASHMVLMHMTHHHQLGGIELGPDMVGNDRRIQCCQRIAAANHDLVAVRILASLGAAKHRHAAKLVALYVCLGCVDGMHHGLSGGK